MRRRPTVGLRLTLSYAAFFSVGLLLFVWGAWVAARHSLLAAVDEQLSLRAGGLAAVVRADSAGGSETHLRGELREYGAAAPDSDVLQVLGPGDTELLPAGDSADAILPLPLPPGGRRGFDTHTVQRVPYRIVTERVLVDGKTYLISTGTPLAPTDRILAHLLTSLLWSAPAVLVLASLAGYWVSRRALSPVGQIAATARVISIENLSRRLAIPAARDELRDLAEVFNEMVRRLETAVGLLKRFTADASHELRTPITLIRAEAELALRRQRTDEGYREALRRIMAESEKTSRLVEDLLALARADAQLRPRTSDEFDLAFAVREVAASMAGLAGAQGVRLDVTAPDAPVLVHGDATAIRRMLIALVDNALKFTAAGGSVAVSVIRENTGAALKVHDTGAGIAASDLPHVFERFYRADPARSRAKGGHGLGLAIAQAIARDHQTVIEAQSELGRGSTFSVRLG